MFSLWSRLIRRRREHGNENDGSDIIDQNEKTKQPSGKMGTFSGVFVPTTLNVLSILMFLRFGFILGQVGVIGMIAILVISYIIDLLTVLSISAISTNGTVRGGGAYYMISRSLGPEFGGSIGIVFYIGQVLNAGLNVVGFVEPIISNFGNEYGITARILPEGRWFEFVYATGLLLLTTVACMLGSAAFTRAGYVLFVILVLATLSVPLSAFFVKPHYIPEFETIYSGLSLATLRNNTLPHFTTGAAGSEINGQENFQDIFGIFFPATAGIFAGASMSGDLRNPGKSIPKGTLLGLLMTFCFYAIVILAMAASIPRQLLYTDVQVLQTVNLSKYVILLGEMSTALFSAIVGILGAAKVLQAIARDDILRPLKIFKMGTKVADEPIYAVIITYVLCQITLLLPINTIASLVTMAFLMTFIVTNVACFLLKVSSAPNFRPSFHFFNSITAAAGGVLCIATMFVVDGIYASVVIAVLIGLFIVIHYVTPPKSWGDVSQTLIYHQVRKYLLLLRQDHVKFWRPQVLLLVRDPRESWNLIHFCNSLKKGALYILGHIVVMDNFQEDIAEMKRIQSAWLKLRDISRVKAFVQMATNPSLIWGARNIILQAGLGGMKPNIAVLGFFDIEKYRLRMAGGESSSSYYSKKEKNSYPHGYASSQMSSVPTRNTLLQNSFKKRSDIDSLPTDSVNSGSTMTVTEYVNIIEDMLAIQMNVAIARGFEDLELPFSWIPKEERGKKFIDLWPIQMSAYMVEPEIEGNILSTNFDTYTLILQLGAILNTVSAWKEFYNLRVIVFVEYEDDVEEERGRLKSLLDNLRIESEVLVFCLSDGSVPAYETILHGRPDTTGKITAHLSNESWWVELQEARSLLEQADLVEPGKPIPMSYLNGEVVVVPSALDPITTAISTTVVADDSLNESSVKQSAAVAVTSATEVPKIKRYLRKRRQTMTNLQKMGMSYNMQTNRLVTEEQNYSDGFNDENVDGTEADDYIDDADDADDADDELGYLTEDTTGYNSGTSSRNGKSRAQDLSRIATSSSQNSTSTLFKSDNSGTANKSGAVPTAIKKQLGNSDTSSILVDIERDAVTSSPQIQFPVVSTSPRPRLPHRSSLATSTMSGVSRDKRSLPNFSGQTIPHSEVLDEEDANNKTIRFASYSRSSTYSTNTTSSNNNNGLSMHPLVPTISRRSTLSKSLSIVPGPFHDERYLSFNDLPARAQHLILNDLMGNVSRDAAVLFATLPAPKSGTHKSEQDSLSYLEELDLWCQDLPPTLLVHSQSVTVTMAL
ncbi:amino acid permease-domain-containing protein [Dipodascopsis uninucleata]